MQQFTLSEFKRIMRESAGEDESLNLDGDVLDQDFTELGYDSLALMETTSRVEREFGLTLPEDEMADVSTPRAYLALVNERLAERV